MCMSGSSHLCAYLAIYAGMNTGHRVRQLTQGCYGQPVLYGVHAPMKLG